MLDADRDYGSAPEAAEKAQLDARIQIDDLVWLMGDKRGRRFMWRLLERAGIYQCSYTPGVDALYTAFREGHRNLGLQLVDEIVKHCPKRLSEMQTEARTK